MATTKTTINAASIARVTSKETGKFLGFLVKSDSTNDYYEVTCLKIAGHCEFFCTCKGFKFHGHCKHCDACKELCEARKELTKQTPAPVATVETPAMHFNGFGHSVNVYISDKEMAEIHARVAMTQAAEQKIAPKAKEASVKRAPQFNGFPLNDTRGFSLLKPTW